ncbi:MAG: hypothetical protein NTV19_03650, partial [Burkholderiales bacterium]|nr:hypothetical protein [Burkholderiales bacterium]
PRGRLVLLLAASYLFYGVWDLRFLSLIAASTAMDFLCAQAIEGERKPLATLAGLCALPVAWFFLVALAIGPAAGLAPVPPMFLALAVAAAIGFAALYTALWRLPAAHRARAFLLLQIGYNLAILFFFKYFGFFVESARALLTAGGLGGDFTVLEILLPVGVSFYTFQSIAYAVDVHRGRVAACRDPLLFAAFIAFFPQLVAGPIERASQLLPQLARATRFDPVFLWQGTALILTGLFKKIRLSENFRLPYLARGPSDFWQRWHISLSTWIRDYLYIPLGGNRGGAARTVRNLTISMLLAGLWHGAAWTFVLWGAWHAALLILYRSVPALGRLERAGGWPRLPAIALMFLFTLVGWLIFRAPDAAFIGHALASLAGTPAPDWQGPAAWVALHVVPLAVLEWMMGGARAAQDPAAAADAPMAHRGWPQRSLAWMILVLLLASSALIEQEFLYFQF